MTKQKLTVYNSLTRKKEIFEPINTPFVGMYVCGPTVYGDAHLGHARPAITFDLVFRYLQHIGYKVRYVRNITDVGHLENDADQGEDKIAKKARIEQVEPMEVVQYFSDRYHEDMDMLNVKKPSIEPRASGHIIEQIEMVKAILDAGYAYEINGSVYFDVEKYHKTHNYGKLSGRVLEDMMANTRDLEGQNEKQNQVDFALWKKASPEHIMRWPSPWSDGFPGWHLECSAMSTKYLGEVFDIHGGGMDLLFPHHECEVAQSNAANGKDAVRYWLHNNMITINGQKMGKSLNNFITLKEFFSGNHAALEKAYDSMTIRFFILQAHYRSTLDFSNEALQAAEKGLKRLFQAMGTLNKLQSSDKSTADISKIEQNCYDAMNDDFNSPIVIAHLFDAVRIINSVNDKKDSLMSKDIEILKNVFKTFLVDILGLNDNIRNDEKSIETINGLMELILDMRKKVREQKDYAASDKIRDSLGALNITVKDSKDGSSWEQN
ncbi:MAG: cysteine--tRNA ligase [Bacteroidetes bacterium]|nr:cysteine--tRNA ligase [Bacteroidota bacterium]